MPPRWLSDYLERAVVIELGDDFTAFGTLVEVGEGHCRLRDVDLHHQGEANSTRDVYALEVKDIGVRPNRRELAVPLGRIVAVSLIEDVSG